MGFHHAFGGARDGSSGPPDKAVRRAKPAPDRAACSAPTPRKLSIVAALIVVSSGARRDPRRFLIKALFNNAIPNGRLGLTTAPRRGGWRLRSRSSPEAFGVVQSYLSTHVRPECDARPAHGGSTAICSDSRSRSSRRRAPARCRAGIANDNRRCLCLSTNVLTSTATSVMSTITTIAGDRDRDVLCSIGKLALLSLGLLPVFVLVHPEGPAKLAARLRPRGRSRMADHQLARAGIALGLGDPARQDDGGAPQSSLSVFEGRIPAPRGFSR